jgi:hypothetical protein
MASKRRTPQEGQGGGLDLEKLKKDIIDALGSGFGTVPSGSVSPSSRQAIGVEGTQTLDPLTGKQTGYYGFKGWENVPYGRQEYPKATQVQPRYFSGDEDMINAMSPEQLADVQYNLYLSGQLGKNYTPGVVDSQTRSAFRDVLGVANRESTDWVTAIKTLKAAQVPGGDLPTFRLSNPDDLKTVFRRAAQEMLGRTLSDEDMKDLVDTFQQRELRFQKQAAAGGTVTEGPQVETFAEKQLTSKFGSEVNVRNMQDIFSQIDQELSRGR